MCFLKRRIVFWGPKHQNLNFLLPKMFLEFNSTHLRYFFFLLFVKMLNRVKMSLSVFLSSFLSFSDGRNWRNFMFFLAFLLSFFLFSFFLHATTRNYMLFSNLRFFSTTLFIFSISLFAFSMALFEKLENQVKTISLLELGLELFLF